MTGARIRNHLMTMQDLKYRDLQIKTIPSVDPERIIGVRTPELRAYAKELGKNDDIASFDDEKYREYDIWKARLENLKNITGR